MMPVQKNSYKSVMDSMKGELKPNSQSMFCMNNTKFPSSRKKIGRLTPEERQEKIDRYKAKRNLRVWDKRINYNCRKRVADKRLRVKGRFVSKAEAYMLANDIKDTNIEINEKRKLCENEKGKKVVKKVFNVISI